MSIRSQVPRACCEDYEEDDPQCEHPNNRSTSEEASLVLILTLPSPGIV
jgi:hypothetical protein